MGSRYSSPEDQAEGPLPLLELLKLLGHTPSFSHSVLV